MLRLNQHSPFSGLIPLLGCLGLVAVFSSPAHAQTNERPYGFTSLSDVTGPFLGNLQTPSTPLSPPATLSIAVSALDNSSRDILVSPIQPNLGEVLKVCLKMTATMDKLSPFAGCSDVNWSHYNRAIQDSKTLRTELVKALQAQKAAIAAPHSPEENQLILKRLELLDKTTTALEATTNTLSALGKAMDKAR